MILCEAVPDKESRVDGRDGLVGRSLWRCSTGQKGALFQQRLVAHGSVKLRHAAESRSEEVSFGRWLRNRRVSVTAMLEHASEGLSARAEGLHVLAIQDTTELNYEAHAGQIKGLGRVGNGRDRGLFVHPMIAVDAASGALLGLADACVWTRHKRARADYRAQPIEEKESYRWLETAARAKATLRRARMITIIADRESDIYEEWARLPDEHCHLITRASRDRAVDGGRLFSISDHWPARDRYTLSLPARPGQPARDAEVSLRFGAVTIKRPRLCSDPDAPAEIKLWLVDVCEIDGSNGKPIRWRLLTTHEVETLDQARQIIAWYRQRWHIEQVFRTMKSEGLDVEASQVTTAKALFNLAVMTLLAAIKIMQLVHARDGQVDRPASDVVPSDQLPLLRALQAKLEGKTALQKNPYPCGSIAWLAWIVARLGGWKGYPSERRPGPITMRNGWQRFEAISQGWFLKDVCIP